MSWRRRGIVGRRSASVERAAHLEVSLDESPRHDPMAALRQRPFVIFLTGRFAAAVGSSMLQAALAWEIYAVTHSAFSLGMVGLVRFGPQLLLSLYAGAVADALDRRRVVLISQLVPLACAAALLTTSGIGATNVPLIYAVIVAIAVANQFENPARQALLPSILTPGTFQNAITVSQSAGALANISGPALAGAAIATVGTSGAWWAYIALQGVAAISIFLLRPRPIEGDRSTVSRESIGEGVRFVLGNQVLLGCMTLDLFAVIFGGAQALLPIYAEDILGVGAFGYGILGASLNAGALLAAGVLVVLPQFERPGRPLLLAVGAFGLATIWFGLSRSFPLSVAAYAAVGMADQFGNVMRTTTENLATPDALRGRMNSVSSLFSGTSNQLGAVESGFVAALTTPTFAVVSGGIGCLVALALVAVFMPQLRSYRVSELASARRESEAAS